MSGHKYSTWEYDAEARAAAEAARRRQLEEAARRRELEATTAREVRRAVATAAPEVQVLAQQIVAALDGTDPVSRRAFGDELTAAGALVERSRAACSEVEGLARLSGTDLVRQGISATSPVLTRLEDLADQMRATLQRAEEIRFHDGPARQGELAGRIGHVQGLMTRADALSGTNEDSKEWLHRLGDLRRDLLLGDFDAVDTGLSALEQTIAGRIDVAALARKHAEERRLVLDALRDSCRHLGYKELNPIALDRSLTDPTAPWVLEVDTRDKGRIRFTVTQDQVEAETSMGVSGDQVVGGVCFAEFEKIENELAAQHGIRTHFQSDTVPRLDPRSPGGARSQPQTVAQPHSASG